MRSIQKEVVGLTKQIMDTKRFSCAELGDFIGVSGATISRWCRGTVPNFGLAQEVVGELQKILIKINPPVAVSVATVASLVEKAAENTESDRSFIQTDLFDNVITANTAARQKVIAQVADRIVELERRREIALAQVELLTIMVKKGQDTLDFLRELEAADDAIIRPGSHD